MSATGVDDERDYLMRVQASPAEMQLLIESVVVPETWISSAIRSRSRRWRSWPASGCSAQARPTSVCCAC